MRDWVEQDIKNKGLNDQVHLLGIKALEDMPLFYSTADALLVTLQNKPVFDMTIPGKIQSYLASGKPIIACLNGEGAVLIETNNVGYVCNSGDSIGLASIVLKMSKDSNSVLKKMGDNAEKLSISEFNKDLLLNKIELFFTNTVRKK
jgi:glycosyltransferase involved in cell wall biosynthesis